MAILPPRAGQGSGAGREVRVRSVQVHDREVAAAGGGQRVALNLTGVDRDEVERGQWVVKDPSIEPTYMADVRLSLLPDAPAPLSRVLRARVDHGTAEILAKVVLADRETLTPGRILLCATPLRRAGARLSGRPFHPAVHHAGDHARGRPGDRPRPAQAQHGAALARPLDAARGGRCRRRGGAAAAGSLPAGSDPGQAGGEPLPVAIPSRQERGGRGGPPGRRPRSADRRRRDGAGDGHGGRHGRAHQGAGRPGPTPLPRSLAAFARRGRPWTPSSAARTQRRSIPT